MNTGVLSIILHQIPDPYHGQWMDICSTILFVFNLIIFFTFILITILRIIIYPSATRQQSANAEESAFWACLPIAAFTIVAQIALTVSTANWNGTGHAFMLLAYVLWWVVVVWTLATGGVVLVFLVKHPATKDEVLPTSVFIPGVSLATAAVVGSNIVSYGYGVSPQLAVPVIIVGYLILGFGANLALGLYSLFLNKLFATGWPPPEKIPSLILLVSVSHRIKGCSDFRLVFANRQFKVTNASRSGPLVNQLRLLFSWELQPRSSLVDTTPALS